MTTTNEEIVRLSNNLREAYHGDLSDCPILLDASDMLLALKARAEKAERQAEDQWAGWIKAEARAKAAEKDVATLREVLERIADAPLYFGDDHGWIMNEARAALEATP